MDIAIAASLIIFGTERVVELIKSFTAKWKELIPWPAVSATVGGLMAWGIGFVILPGVALWLNYVLIGLALGGGVAGGLHDLLKLLQLEKDLVNPTA